MLNTICNIRNNIKNRMGKQHNKIANLILAVITPHTTQRLFFQIGAKKDAAFKLI